MYKVQNRNDLLWSLVNQTHTSTDARTKPRKSTPYVVRSNERKWPSAGPLSSAYLSMQSDIVNAVISTL